MGTSSTLPKQAHGLTVTVLGVLCIGVLIGTSYWILHPFLPALIWAAMIVISTWPLLIKLQTRLKGRRGYATVVMVLGLIVTLMVPLLFAASTIVENTEQLGSWIHSLSTFNRPPPPDWLENVPVVGQKLVTKWKLLAASSKDDLITRATPYMGELVSWLIAQIGNVGLLIVHFLLTLVLSAVLYQNGEFAAQSARNFASRLAGVRGDESVRLAAKAVRAVALGVIGTAICQSMLAGLGYVIAGVPQAALLTAVTFFFSIIQVGPTPVMVPVTIWLFWSEMTGWGSVMIIWTVLVTIMDNFMRPVLIKRGANLPLLLVFAGVIGGLIAFGVIGLFIGPVVLAVSYTLLRAWVAAPSSSPAESR